MYEIKKYQDYHLGMLKVSAETKSLVDFVGSQSLSSIFSVNGPAYSVFHDGEIFAISGINVMWPRVGEAWALFGVNFRQHGKFIHRNVVKYIRKLQVELNLERLQAVVLKDHWAAIEWMDRLGFTFEGEMERYFQGKTYLRYAKIYER